MASFTTTSGVVMFYKDWGAGRPIVFSHGWPLNSDAWEHQMMFFAQQWERCSAHNRRGLGRSEQVWHGNNMDTYAADLAELLELLELEDAVFVGHSTGGGKVVVSPANDDSAYVSQVVLVGAITPSLGKTESTPYGLPDSVFEEQRQASIQNRGELYLDLAADPFFRFNRSGVQVSKSYQEWFWMLGMQAGHANTYACIYAFFYSDFVEYLRTVEVPVLIVHGNDDQIVTIHSSAMGTHEILRNSILKIYSGGSYAPVHMNTAEYNLDLLEFIRGKS